MANPKAKSPAKSVGPKSAKPAAAKPVAGKSKLDALTAILQSPKGASIAALMKASGWQAHSVRGALAGALKKRGLNITSDKIDGVRTYKVNP